MINRIIIGPSAKNKKLRECEIIFETAEEKSAWLRDLEEFTSSSSSSSENSFESLNNNNNANSGCTCFKIAFRVHENIFNYFNLLILFLSLLLLSNLLTH
jgi:hypothetical protein